jgi:hypothetical protein
LLKTLKTIVKVIWAGSMIVLSTGAGAAYGWQQHGLGGAIALGFVGLVVGLLLASSPTMLLQLLQ